MPLIRPVRGEAGVFETAGGQRVKIVEWREDDKYDTVDFTAAAITSGTTKEFFRDLDKKEKLDTNITTPRRIAGGQEMIIDRIGMSVPAAFGDTVVTPRDVKKLAENAHLLFQINDIIVAEGPLSKFPAGYGISGQSNENDAGVVQIGVPSTAAQSRLLKEQFVNRENDLNAIATWHDRKWRDGGLTNMPTLGSIMVLRMYLHGLLRVATTRG